MAARVDTYITCLVTDEGVVYCVPTYETVSFGKNCFECIEESEYNLYCVPAVQERSIISKTHLLHREGACVDKRILPCPAGYMMVNNTKTCDCPYYYTDEECFNNVNCC